jgi:hypothetical protein
MANNMKSWLPLGEATLGLVPQSLTTLYPNLAGINNNCFTVCVQAHESNNQGIVIYIGDGTLVSSLNNAGYVLVGPYQFNKFENQGANNSLDLDDFYLAGFDIAKDVKVRVYVLVG